jgi:hypothetical protein
MRRAPIFTSLIFVLSTSCSSGGDGGEGGGEPSEGNAYLTVVGDSNVFMELGNVTELRVRYHDQAGNPLAGEVGFHISGMAAGSSLAAPSDVTDANGQAAVGLTAGPAQVSFRVVAEAEFATPVEWRVAISPQGGVGALDVNGKYAVDSQFDMATGLPGDAGEVVNTFVAMSDGPNDPATFLLDEIVDNIDSSFLRNVVNGMRPALDAYLNDVLRDTSPGLVDTLRDLGSDFGEVARRFGMRSQLFVAPAAAGTPEVHTAIHSVTGFHWNIDGVTYEYSMADLGLGEVKAENVGVTAAPDKIVIAEHALAVPYGQLLVFVLNQVVIPTIEPFADSVEDVLSAQIDCAEIGWRIWIETDTGTAGMYQAACQSALASASDAIEDEIRGLDANGGTSLILHGDARPADTNADAMVDQLTMGLWEGTFRVGGAEAALARPDQKFLGERMATP